MKHQLNTVHFVIVELNNSCRWTRERIADWVETIERERGLIAPAVEETETETVTA